jgi:hypothetical protein
VRLDEHFAEGPRGRDPVRERGAPAALLRARLDRRGSPGHPGQRRNRPGTGGRAQQLPARWKRSTRQATLRLSSPIYMFGRGRSDRPDATPAARVIGFRCDHTRYGCGKLGLGKRSHCHRHSGCRRDSPKAPLSSLSTAAVYGLGKSASGATIFWLRRGYRAARKLLRSVPWLRRDLLRSSHQAILTRVGPHPGPCRSCRSLTCRFVGLRGQICALRSSARMAPRQVLGR